MSNSHRVLLAAILLAHLAFNLSLSGMLELCSRFAWGWEPLLFLTLIGFCFGQANLIAVWGAFAPGKLVVRLSWACLLAVMMWYALILGVRLSRSLLPLSWYGVGMERSEALLLGSILIPGVLIALVPLWAASRGFRWRLVSPSGGQDASVADRQFHLKHLLGGMVAVSVMLGLGRVVMPTQGEWTILWDRELAVLVPIAVAGNLLIAAPCIWWGFAPLDRLVAVSGVWLVYVALMSIVEFGVISSFLGDPGSHFGLVIASIAGFNAAQCACIVLTLRAVKQLGFRLVRVELPTVGDQAAHVPTPQTADAVEPRE